MRNNNNVPAAAAGASSTSSIPIPNMPVQESDGIWSLTNPDEHAALMEYAADKLVILKVFAPWCRACKGLEPKFLQVSREPEYTANVPILWANLSIQHNKAFVQGLGVLALPTIQFYVGGKLLDTFPCGPSKVPIFKRKLSALIADHVDTATGQLKPGSIEHAAAAAEEAANRVKEAAAKKEQDKLLFEKATAPPPAVISSEDRKLFQKIPYFSALSLADFDQVVDKAVKLTFQPGAILVREGKPGQTFYVIESGEVEICQQTFQLADPMVQQRPSVTDSSGYLGTVVNRLGAGDYFGERALITGEPRAASLRVAYEPVTLWAFDKDIFPHSCVLSGKSTNTAQHQQNLDQVNDKYGLDISGLYQQQILAKVLRESATANQVRGSVNTPTPLLEDDAVSTADSEVDADDLAAVGGGAATAAAANVDRKVSPAMFPASMVSVVKNDDAIFSLLSRFQMIRHVSTCFKYIQESRAVWGDAGSRTRRNMLVSRLSPMQRTEFTEIFELMDVNQDNCIDLSELKRLMESIGEPTDELQFPARRGGNDDDETCVEGTTTSAVAVVDNDACVGTGGMTYEDYMGIMAEAKFYNLFLEIFSSLDENASGFVRARDLDRVLCGVRDLISDDRKSVIDVDDKDMLIDYEQFARMLLGTTLL
jgi:calmodulin